MTGRGPVPLADEIREARRLTQESADAQRDLHLVEMVHRSAHLLEQRLYAMPQADFEVPGDDALAGVAARWPQLRGLGDAAPKASQPLKQRLILRKMQAQAAIDALRPLARVATVRATEMHELQHRQQHELVGEEWAGLVGELQQVGVLRDQILHTLAPKQRLIAMFEPLLLIADTALRERTVDADALRADASGTLAFSLAIGVAATVRALGDAMAQVELALPVPTPPVVPAAPSPGDVDRLIIEVRTALDGLATLRMSLDRGQRETRAEVDALTAEHDRLTQRLIEDLG